MARLVREVLADVGLVGALKTSGAKGLHVFVPVDADAPFEDSAAATRAIAARVERLDPELATTAFVKDEREGKVFVDSTRVGGATVVAAYSPRVRPGVPVSFPLALGRARRGRRRPTSPSTPRSGCWATPTRGPSRCRDRSTSTPSSIAEGHEIPVARVQAMHEGKRRARPRRA